MSATWLDVHRALHAAGWRHERNYLQPSRDADGAPCSDGSWEHRWRRGWHEVITAYSGWGEPGTVGWLSLWAPADGDESTSITAGHLARRGPEWALKALELLGILAADSEGRGREDGDRTHFWDEPDFWTEEPAVGAPTEDPA